MALYPRIDYLVALSTTIGPNECAEKFGVSRSYIRLVGYGHKRCSAKTATQLEIHSEGKVTRKELRKDDWHLIWPELA